MWRFLRDVSSHRSVDKLSTFDDLVDLNPEEDGNIRKKGASSMLPALHGIQSIISIFMQGPDKN